MREYINIYTKDPIMLENTTIYPDFLLSVSQYLTVFFAGILLVVLGYLWFLFSRYRSKLDILLTRAFKAEWFRTIVTFLMGASLYTDFADGVKTLVIIRPLVLAYACYVLLDLLKHYLELFDLDMKTLNLHIYNSVKRKLLTFYNFKKSKVLYLISLCKRGSK